MNKYSRYWGSLSLPSFMIACGRSCHPKTWQYIGNLQ